MENKSEFKYQWSSKVDNGEIMVIRNDSWEDLWIDVEAYKTGQGQENPQESHPEVSSETLEEKYAGKTLSEIPETDESYCSIHNVKMKERIGKNGKFFSHARGEFPDLDWCSGSGFKGDK